MSSGFASASLGIVKAYGFVGEVSVGCAEGPAVALVQSVCPDETFAADCVADCPADCGSILKWR